MHITTLYVFNKTFIYACEFRNKEYFKGTLRSCCFYDVEEQLNPSDTYSLFCTIHTPEEKELSMKELGGKAKMYVLMKTLSLHVKEIISLTID
jgi:hypothetical protein